MRRNVTLNFGARYGFITNPTESHGRFSSLVNLNDPTVTHLPHVFAQNPSLKNIAPRFGFAWDATGDGKTSIRGGFGIFYQEYMPRDYGDYGFNPPETVLEVGIFPGFPIAPSALFGLPPSISLVTGYHITTSPYLLEYNLNVQRELLPGLVFEAGGLFSGGRKLLGAYDYNQPLPNAILPDGTPIRTATSVRPNPNFSSLQFTFPMHSSSYNALVMTLEKRFSRGSRFLAAYTWSHSLDTQSNEFNGDGWNDSGETTDIRNLKRDHGNSTFDVRQNLTVNYTYDLQFGSGLRGVPGKLAGGWQFTGIATFHSGLPFSLENGFDRARTLRSFDPPNASDRPDLKRWPSMRETSLTRFCVRFLWPLVLSTRRCWRKRRKTMKPTKAKTTHQTIPLRDRCLSHFATLRMPVEATALDELLTRAEKESFSHLSFLDRLLGAEADARRERTVARRIREARFAENKTLEAFDWNFYPKTFDRVQLEELATGDFIRRRTNLVMVGWSGIGKSHVIQALGQLRARSLSNLGAGNSLISPLRWPTRLFPSVFAATRARTF